MKAIELYRKDIYKGCLVLVNRDHPIHDDFYYSTKMLPINSASNDILLELKASILLGQLLKSIDHQNEIIPVSGFRTSQEQEKIYDESLMMNGEVFTNKYVALPNRSEHQTGLAIDLAKKANHIDFIRPEFPYTGVCGVFRKKATSYGFIERYKKEKEQYTGISYEPWHFRYIGYPHAQILQDYGLSLEEYILFIKNFPYEGKHFIKYQHAKLFEIFYVPATSDNTTIHLSEDDCYQISGNNVDGFIVTIWR